MAPADDDRVKHDISASVLQLTSRRYLATVNVSKSSAYGWPVASATGW